MPKSIKINILNIERRKHIMKNSDILKAPKLFKKPKQEKANGTPEICCPYFDDENKACSHPQCIRMIGYECKYSNRKIK